MLDMQQQQPTPTVWQTHGMWELVQQQTPSTRQITVDLVNILLRVSTPIIPTVGQTLLLFIEAPLIESSFVSILDTYIPPLIVGFSLPSIHGVVSNANVSTTLCPVLDLPGSNLPQMCPQSSLSHLYSGRMPELRPQTL